MTVRGNARVMVVATTVHVMRRGGTLRERADGHADRPTHRKPGEDGDQDESNASLSQSTHSVQYSKNSQCARRSMAHTLRRINVAGLADILRPE